VDYHTKTTANSLEELQSSVKGLSKSEVVDRQKQYGLNVIAVKGEPLWRKLIEPFANIFMLVLFIAAIASFLHHEYIDAVIIGTIIFINAAIYYIQRFSTERILRALQKKNKHLVDVLRDSETVQIDTEEIVPGDIIVLDEGEKIPADCRLIETSSLRVDESQLTGESLPIDKQTDAIAMNKEIYERTNMVYQGSFVVGGQAKALVVATGNNTEFGKLAALSVAPHEVSPVQKRISNLISILVRVISVVALAAFALSLYRGMNINEAIRYVLALSVSAVPESLPVAITVVLVLGMRRIAAKKALVKNPSAIETIGIINTIASDKTGTLTRNILTIQDTWSVDSKDTSITNALSRSVLPAVSKTRDPLDNAIEIFLEPNDRLSHDKIKTTLPFEQAFAMSGNIIHDKGSKSLWIKGSPEHVIERCKISKAAREAAHAKVQSMAANGLRVLAFAHTPINNDITSFEQLPQHTAFIFDGLVGVADVLRPEAKTAIKNARNAGIRVCMVTGDHFETAFHISKQLGVVSSRDEVFDSRKMHTLSDDELTKVVEKVRVFARVIPENKHRLLTILKQNQITAMTGDGVNDVPALAGAHVGIAMGSGTSIAKDAGDIILLDDNFRTIVNAIHEGRTVYANIKRMVAYLLSTNAGEVMVAIGALIIGVPVPLAAVQILWVNLVTDTFMVIPLGLEPGEKRNMQKPPQKYNTPLFSRFMLSRIMVTASTMASLTLFLYLSFLSSHSVEYARTIAFNALVVMQWASAFNSRSDYESIFSRIRRFSAPFYFGLFMAVASQTIAMVGILRDPLHISSAVSFKDIMTTTAIAFIVPIIVIEIHKFIGRRFFNKGSRQTTM
jgi:Ca2+-transporting ATPase